MEVHVTDAEVAEQQARVERLIAWWGEELGIRACWNVDYKFLRECARDEPDCIMETLVRWQYAHAIMTAYLPVVAEQTDDELEHGVVHEYMHLLLNEMRARWDKSDPQMETRWDEERLHEEHACTTLARAFIWVRDAAQKPATRDEHPVLPGAPEPNGAGGVPEPLRAALDTGGPLAPREAHDGED